jgi:hypothetical protein
MSDWEVAETPKYDRVVVPLGEHREICRRRKGMEIAVIGESVGK